MGPWPTPDLTHRGLFLIGHPPFMLRPPGPATPIPDVEGFVVTEAVDGPSLEVVERVLIEGFPLPELLPVEPGRAFDARVLGRPDPLLPGLATGTRRWPPHR